MRHFSYLSENELDDIFYIKPTEFYTETKKDILSMALGASLYTPAIKEGIAEDLLSIKYPQLTTNVFDLEDAIGTEQVEEGLVNLKNNFAKITYAIENEEFKRENLPIMFLRVRDAKQFKEVVKYSADLELLTGFVFPKVTKENVGSYFKTLLKCNTLADKKFYGMPILETDKIIYKESRKSELMAIKHILDIFKDLVLNVRIGGTDFSGLYGIRRTIDTTIYDVQIVRECITDILNFFTRQDNYYVCSGVVWEYFNSPAKHRMLKPELRETPFLELEGKQGYKTRNTILNNAIDGLIRETILDKTNGIIGKTVIHPTHISYVNALQAVTREEYEDALMIVNNQDKGVIKSATGDKMNEMRPHFNWANLILKKAQIYGVLNYDKSYNALFI